MLEKLIALATTTINEIQCSSEGMHPPPAWGEGKNFRKVFAWGSEMFMLVAVVVVVVVVVRGGGGGM